MTPNPTKAEIDALEREIQVVNLGDPKAYTDGKTAKWPRIHHAVNPERYSARIMKAVIKREQGDACI